MTEGVVNRMSGMLRTMVVVLMVCGLMQARAQEDTPQKQPTSVPGEEGRYALTVNTQMVVLDVVVTDKTGANVKGLSKDDFTVYEDQAPQEVRSFEEFEPHPVVAGKATAINSTAELDRVEPDAPVSILVIDEVTTSFEDLAFARYSLMKYLKAQGDTLLQPTMLVSANYRNIAVLRDYTTSKEEILDALDRHVANSAALTRSRNPSWWADQINATFGSLIGVAEATAGHRGHKNMIWIGRGFPPINMAMLLTSMQTDFDKQLADCTRLLRDSRVTLYTIDPAGISTQMPARDGADFYTEDPFGGQVDFDTMAISTGGKALHERNDVNALIDESVRDGESFYTLAYRPTGNRQQGKPFRAIRIVMRDPSLKASTRQGYFVKPAQVAPLREANGKFSNRLMFDLSAASGSLLVYDGVPLIVTRDATAADSFALHVHTSDLPLEEDASRRPSAQLTVLAESFDRRGKVLRHEADVYTVRMNAQAADGAIDKRVITIPVKIGTEAPAARIRFVVRANGNGKLGAENYFLVDRSTLDDPATGLKANKGQR
jgi:VWFA-related protein